MVKLLGTILLSLACVMPHAFAQSRINVRNFGAKGDGVTNDTKAIQRALDRARDAEGGCVYLGSGTFIVDSLVVGFKTSIEGDGNGATILQQSQKVSSNFIIIYSCAAALHIEHLSLRGHKSGAGLYFRSTAPATENQAYLFSKESNWKGKQPYKWINIDDICIYGFDTGLYIDNHGFNINVSNSTIASNGDGIYFRCTDSAIYNCYVNNNKRNGLIIAGGNNRVSNIKSIFNGISKPRSYSAVVVSGSRCMINNIETQDNYCKAFTITGSYNVISNCLSNTDGYTGEPKRYEFETDAYGFYVKGLYNSFSNCMVTNYNTKYGAVYKSPVFVDPAVEYAYQDILNDIKVCPPLGAPFFHEVVASHIHGKTKSVLEGGQLVEKNDGKYLKATDKNLLYVGDVADYTLEGLSVIADFVVPANPDSYARVWSIGMGAEGIELVLVNQNGKSFYSLYSAGVKYQCAMDIADIHSLAGKEQRVAVSFERRFTDGRWSLFGVIRCYVYEGEKGWTKREASKRIDDDMIDKIRTIASRIMIGKNASEMYLGKLAAGYSIPVEDYLLPGSNLSCLQALSDVFVDAWNCQTKK